MEQSKNLRDSITKFALSLGFDFIGFSKAYPLEKEGILLDNWIYSGYHAEMNWITRTLDKRKNPKLVLENALSVISLGMNYYQSSDSVKDNNTGKISRYAYGKDYHEVIEEKNYRIIEFIHSLVPDSSSVGFVDSGPTMDKVMAVNGGLGWLSKNTNVINPKSGSWFFISNIITTIELESSEIIPDHCGDCTRCIEACPTNALAPYILDSNKCISYLTIENKKEIPDSFLGKFENYIFGCDICQEVCPWNIKLAVETKIKEFSSNTIKELSPDEIDRMDEKEFNIKFNQSPIKRAKLKGIKRNSDFIKRSSNGKQSL